MRRFTRHRPRGERPHDRAGGSTGRHSVGHIHAPPSAVVLAGHVLDRGLAGERPGDAAEEGTYRRPKSRLGV